MMRQGYMMAMLMAAGAIAAPAAAAKPAAPPATPPAQVQKLLACRGLTDSVQRLACFDRETSAMADGIARRDLVVVDRELVRSTRRSLFGLTLPRIGILDDDQSTEVKQLDGVIAGVGRNSDGGYVFVLQDDGRWSQIDSNVIAVEPRPGDKVVIRRATMGSFMLSVDRQPAVRVKRIQ
jgi:hypothetical protein